MDLAPEAQGDTSDDQPVVEMKPGLLTIPWGKPTDVYIRAKGNAGNMIAGFSLQPHGTFYTGGITWQSSNSYALFVTFHFEKHVTKVDCDGLPYSPVYGSKNDKQDLCILATSPATYDFTVEFTSGKPHDPEIVVTPPSLSGT